MKKTTKILLLLLCVAFSFSLFACGGDEDSDDGGNPPATEVVNDVELITDGVAKFRIVLGSKIPTDVRRTVELQILPALKAKGIEVIAAQEGNSNDAIEDVEVLVGDVTSRGDEYVFDRYMFGNEGYMIKIVGTKIVIQAGSDEKLLDAVLEFAEDILRTNSKDAYDAVMTKDDVKYYIQNDYKITSLSVGSTDMKGYTIAADSTDKYYKTAATSIQETVYDKTGYFFPIVKPAEATDKSVVIQHVDRKTVSGEDTFTVKADGMKLVISCAYDNMLERAVGEFLSQYIILASGDVSFSGTVAEKDVSFVTYEDFNAKGDGKANDYQAFYDTHVFANECGQTVKANPSKTYLLSDPTVKTANGELPTAIPIKTNVEWDGADIIIDDSDIDIRNPATKGFKGIWVFSVQPDVPMVEWKASDSRYSDVINGLGKVGYSYETEKIDLGLGYPAMLIVYNENHQVYRRTGSDRYDGSGPAQHEVIVIDKNGNIDKSTPFMFDYDELTKIQIYRIDNEPIKISGGTVTTVAPQYDNRYYTDGTDPETGAAIKIEHDMGYFARGLVISRSFTTVEDVDHYVKNEVTIEDYFKNHIQGAVYNGFFNASNATDILIKDCVMTGRRCYNTHGTYEFSANCVNKIVLEGCYQHNFWVDEEGKPSDDYTGRTSMDSVSYEGLVAEDGKTTVQYCWGIGGTNFCKNMHYIDSRISRFDAHCGLYDGSIVNCEISFFEIIGKGTFILKDTDFYSNGSGELVYLRGDYGCTWEGDFIIENVHCYVDPGKQFSIFRHGLTNWYYGYKCHIPAVEIKDVYIHNNETLELYDSSYQYLHMYTKISDKYMHRDTLSTGTKNENPIGVPEYLKISSNVNGYQFRLPYDSDPHHFLAGIDFYSGDTKVEYKQGNRGWFTFY